MRNTDDTYEDRFITKVDILGQATDLSVTYHYSPADLDVGRKEWIDIVDAELQRMERVNWNDRGEHDPHYEGDVVSIRDLLGQELRETLEKLAWQHLRGQRGNPDYPLDLRQAA